MSSYLTDHVFMLGQQCPTQRTQQDLFSHLLEHHFNPILWFCKVSYDMERLFLYTYVIVVYQTK